MKTSLDYIGKPAFRIHFLSEELKKMKDYLKFIENVDPLNQEIEKTKQETIEVIKQNIIKITEELKNL